MEQRSPRTWRNTRRKSLYTEEAANGFIYRKLPSIGAPKREGKPLVPTSGAKLTRSPLHSSKKPAAQREERETEGERGEGERGESEGEREEEMAVDDSCATDDREVEISCFIVQLKKELRESGAQELGAEDNLDAVLDSLVSELLKTDLYFRSLEEEDEDLPPHPLEASIKEHIDTLKQNIAMYRRELSEWDEVEKRKIEEEEEYLKHLDSERTVNWLHLEHSTEEALKTYLTPEQMSLLDEEGAELGEGLAAECRQQLDTAKSAIDDQLSSIQEFCSSVQSKLKFKHPDVSVVEETPKTLFRALRDQS